MEKSSKVSILYIVFSTFAQNSLWYGGFYFIWGQYILSREEEGTLHNFRSLDLQKMQDLSFCIQSFKEHSPYACWLPDSEWRFTYTQMEILQEELQESENMKSTTKCKTTKLSDPYAYTTPPRSWGTQIKNQKY